MKKSKNITKIISKLLVISLLLNIATVKSAPTKPAAKPAAVAKKSVVQKTKKDTGAAAQTSETSQQSSCPDPGPNEFCNVPWISAQQAAPSQEDCKNMADDNERKTKGCFDATSVCDAALNSNDPSAPVTLNDYASTVSNAVRLQSAVSNAANNYADAQNQLLTEFQVEDTTGSTLTKNCLYFLTTPDYKKEVKTPMPGDCALYLNTLEKNAKDLLDAQTALIDLLSTQGCFDKSGYDLTTSPLKAGNKIIQLMPGYPACAINQAVKRMLNTQKIWSKECATFMTAQQQAQYKKQLDDQAQMQENQKPKPGDVWGQIVGGGLISAIGFVGIQAGLDSARTGESLTTKFKNLFKSGKGVTAEAAQGSELAGAASKTLGTTARSSIAAAEEASQAAKTVTIAGKGAQAAKTAITTGEEATQAVRAARAASQAAEEVGTAIRAAEEVAPK